MAAKLETLAALLGIVPLGGASGIVGLFAREPGVAIVLLGVVFAVLIVGTLVVGAVLRRVACARGRRRDAASGRRVHVDVLEPNTMASLWRRAPIGVAMLASVRVRMIVRSVGRPRLDWANISIIQLGLE